MSEPKALAWIDIETTGTRYDCDAVLEIAIIFTPTFESNGGWDKPDVGELGTFSMVCKPSMPVALIDIDPFVFNMHQKSGLWDECMNTSVTFEEAMAAACAAMEHYGAEGSPMCGSSVHFDRQFLNWRAGRNLVNQFHYRNLDVSTLKNMVNLHLQGKVTPFEQPKDKAHRALDDLRVTLEEYRHYLAAFTRGLNPYTKGSTP